MDDFFQSRAAASDRVAFLCCSGGSIILLRPARDSRRPDILVNDLVLANAVSRPAFRSQDAIGTNPCDGQFAVAIAWEKAKPFPGRSERDKIH